MIAWFTELMSREKRLLTGFLFAVAVVLIVILILLLKPPKPAEALPAETADEQLEESAEGSDAGAETAEPEAAEAASGTVLSVTGLSFARDSESVIRLIWPDDLDDHVSAYEIWRSEASEPDRWAQVGELSSDGLAAGQSNSWADHLRDSAPHQYYYRVDLQLPKGSADRAADGRAVLASNVQVCIDPGHYLNSSLLEGDELYGYGEGLFMMQLGRALRTELGKYGIQCVLTREGDDISLGGYTNGDLDNSHISLRGQFAAGSNLFLSLHTNANLDNANGFPTCNQPIGINKTLVFVNQPAMQSEVCILAANEIGKRVSAVNYRCGLSASDQFTTASAGSFHDWSDAFNDSLNTPGAVCFRPGEKGNDYYGVLRGAAAVGVPGLIVEHAFHTVAEVRRSAMQGDLAQRWAEADAAGIAEAFHFISAK